MLKANTKVTLAFLMVLIVWSIVFDIWRRYKPEVLSRIITVIVEFARPEAQVFEMHRFPAHHFCRLENPPSAMSKSGPLQDISQKPLNAEFVLSLHIDVKSFQVGKDFRSTFELKIIVNSSYKIT